MAPMCSLGGQRNHPEGGLPGTGEAVTLAQAWSHPHLNPLPPIHATIRLVVYTKVSASKSRLPPPPMPVLTH